MKRYTLFSTIVIFSLTMPSMAQDLGETPQQAAVHQKSDALTKAGDGALKLGDWATAESDFRGAITAVSSNSGAYRGLAATLTAQGRNQEAIQVYRELIYGLAINNFSSNDPKQLEAHQTSVFQDPTHYDYIGSQDVSVWMNYVLLLSQTAQWSEAVNIYEKALPHLGTGVLPKIDMHFDPHIPAPNQLQASAHLVLGIDDNNRLEHDEALNEYNKALQLQPASGLINFYYGYGLQRLGRPAEAQVFLKKASENGNGDVKAAAEKALR